MVFCRSCDRRTDSFASTLPRVDSARHRSGLYHSVLGGFGYLCRLMLFFFLLDLVLDLNANIVLAPSLVRWLSDVFPPIFWGNVISGLDSCARTLCCEPARVATVNKHRRCPRLGGFGYVGSLCCLRCGLMLVVLCFYFFFPPLFDVDLNAQPWLATAGSPDVDLHPYLV